MFKIWSRLQCCLKMSIPLKSTFVQVAESPPTSLDSKYDLKCNAINSNLKRTAARKSLQIQFPAIQAHSQPFKSHPGSPQFSHSGSFLFSLYSAISYLFQFYFFMLKSNKIKKIISLFFQSDGIGQQKEQLDLLTR